MELTQELDPTLVRRLWRPVERPGVIDPGLSRVLLDRHRRMVAGLPLAELLSRHTGSASDLAGPDLPIVYAQPGQPPTIADSRPHAAGLSPTPPHPIGPDRAASPAAGPAPSPAGAAQPAPPAVTATAPGSPVPPVASPAVPIVHDPERVLVVQRPVPAPGSPPAPAVPEGVGSVPPRPLVPGSRPSELPPLDPHRPGTGRPGTEPPDRVSPGSPVVGSALQRPPLPAVRPLRLPPQQLRAPNAEPSGPGRPGLQPGQPGTPIVVAHPLPRPSWERPAGTLPPPESASWNSAPRDSGSRDSVLRDSVPGESRYLESGHLESGYLAAGPLAAGRTSRARAVAVRRPYLRAGETLPLVDLAAAPAGPARDRSMAAEQRDPRGHRPPVASHPGQTGHDDPPRGADRGGAAQRQVSAPIDVEHIVDTVHRRFVRRLAIEAERRAVR